MARNVSNDSSGSKAKETGPSILGGTRRRLYQHEEDLVVISRDKFDTLESVLFDRSVFSHLSVATLTFSATLGVEMGVEYYYTNAPAQGALLMICGVVGVFGILFLGLTIWKQILYRKTRTDLFSEERLLADETVINRSDGSTVRIDHLEQS